MIVVSDTSPITNLLIIGRLDLLRGVFWISPRLISEVLEAAGEN